MASNLGLFVKIVILAKVSSSSADHREEAQILRRLVAANTIRKSTAMTAPHVTSDGVTIVSLSSSPNLVNLKVLNVTLPPFATSPVVSNETSLRNSSSTVNTNTSSTPSPPLQPSPSTTNVPIPSTTSQSTGNTTSHPTVTSTSVHPPLVNSSSISSTLNVTSPPITINPVVSNQTSLTNTSFTASTNAPGTPSPSVHPSPSTPTADRPPTTPQSVVNATSRPTSASTPVNVTSPPTTPLTPPVTTPTTQRSTTTMLSTPSSIVNTTSKCQLGDDILHILFNRTTNNQAGYAVEQSVGIVGTREEVLAALANATRNYTRQQIEPCLDQYGVPARPAGRPDSSASSHLSYARPSHLGAVPNIPVPKPPSSNFEYGHGYNTYLSPFRIAERVPDFQPNRYQMANSIQDIFVTAFSDFQRDLDTLFQYGRPAYWFGRNK